MQTKMTVFHIDISSWSRDLNFCSKKIIFLNDENNRYLLTKLHMMLYFIQFQCIFFNLFKINTDLIPKCWFLSKVYYFSCYHLYIIFLCWLSYRTQFNSKLVIFQYFFLYNVEYYVRNFSYNVWIRVYIEQIENALLILNKYNITLQFSLSLFST